MSTSNDYREQLEIMRDATWVATLSRKVAKAEANARVALWMCIVIVVACTTHALAHAWIFNVHEHGQPQRELEPAGEGRDREHPALVPGSLTPEDAGEGVR